MTFYWTDDNECTLREMWAAGRSGDDIKNEIGAPTRNAVMGKIHRLGLARNTAGSPGDIAQKKKPRAKRRSPFKPEPPVAPPPVLLVLPVEVHSNPVTLLELEDHHCRFPLGDPQHESFHFCGAPRVKDSPYCNAHHLIAYPPRSSRPAPMSHDERVRRAKLDRENPAARTFA